MQRYLAATKEQLKDLLQNRKWRLNNLYFIQDALGNKVKFRMNWVQEHFYENMHYFNVILKARQLGFSTFILIYILDSCIFNQNHRAGIICDTRENAEELFNTKIKFAYENMPDFVFDVEGGVKAKQDNARSMKFSNGSAITVGTSLRGGTFQKLHISEYGKISAKYPDKAAEIKSGAFNTVHRGQQIFVESTAEGQSGEFFDLVQLGKRLQQEKAELTPLDPKFHFYPWFKNPNYVMHPIDAARITLNDEQSKYFNGLQKDEGIDLTQEQKAWYVKKELLMQDLMMREFPSTAEEAFAASIAGSYYGKQLAFIRKAGQVTRVPWEPGTLVDTFWDLGNFNYTSIWFFQRVARENRMIRFYQSAGDDLTEYARYLRELGYNFGTHYLPHDGNAKRLSTENKSIREMLENLGVKPIKIVPVSKDRVRDIETKCKPEILKMWFDAVNCAEGLKCLDNYKREWDDRRAIWKNEPKHDEFSDGADAFRTFATGYQTNAVGAAPVSFLLPTAKNSFMSAGSL